MTPRALTVAGSTKAEIAAVELSAARLARRQSVLRRARRLSGALGRPGYLGRVVARAAIEGPLDGVPPTGEILSALRLLPDQGLAA